MGCFKRGEVLRKLILVMVFLVLSRLHGMASAGVSERGGEPHVQEQTVSLEDIEVINDLDFFDNWNDLQDDENFKDDPQWEQAAKGGGDD